jgi:hypothetical protein
MMTMKQSLAERVANWERLGHPAMLDRFILRNGKPYTPAKRVGRKGEPKNCFGNATKYVLRNKGPIYVEGFVVSNTVPWPIHHAWVSLNETDAMDLTLESENYQYFGVPFDTDTLRKELVRNGHYGLLDTGLGFNTRLMFKLDPELKAICEAVAADPVLKKLMERQT